MKPRVLKSVISTVLALALFLGFFAPLTGGFAVVASALDNDEVYVSIDKTYLKLGEELRVDNPSGLELEYFVGDEAVASGALVLTEEYLEKWITVRATDGVTVYEDRAYFSRLPVLYVNTDDGKPVTSKTEYKTGNMYVQGNTDAASPQYDGAIQIKGRGNTSWGLPKKPYKIKLDKKTDLFGMGKNKHWVLISNYIDESLMRNKTAYEISRELGLEYMDSVWCDVVFNGEYAGNYVLCEQIRVGETRVDIFDWESEAEDVAKAIAKAEKKKGNVIDQSALEDCMTENLSWITSGVVEFEGAVYETGKTYDDISGGYLFELSNEYDEVSKFLTENGLKVMINSPEFLYTNEEMTAFVQELWGNIEEGFRSEDGYAETEDGRVHYTELTDIDSLASYWLVMEIMGNVDAFYKSRYAYVDLGSKLYFGPAWDFDYSAGSVTVSYLPQGWKATKRNSAQDFFNDVVDDPYFAAKATEKYWKLRPYLEGLFEDGGTVDGYISYLAESGAADGARWDRSERWPDKSRGFAEDAEMFKSYMRERIAWLDLQFSSEKALMWSTNSVYSSNRYTKSDDKISFEVGGAAEDIYSSHAAASGVVTAGKSASVKIKTKDAATVSFDVYLNGLFFGSYGVEDGAAEFEIEASRFTEQTGKKNVISVIGRNADGASTFKNYYTAVVREPLYGDADLDGELSAKDVLIIRHVIAGLVELTDEENDHSDINRDGAVNAKDVLKLRRVIAGLD